MRSLNKPILLLALVLLVPESFGQVNKSGIPLFTNYSPTEFNFAEQNWSIVQDKRGLMYFANSEGAVLEYDGLNFRKIPIPGNNIVNSLAVDENGIVFVGANGEFGLLEPNSIGALQFKSLRYLIDSSLHDIAINNILVLDHHIYFCMENQLLIYDYHTIKIIPLEKKLWHWRSFIVYNTIYLGTHNAGLMQLSGSVAVNTRGGEFFRNKDITAIIPYKNKKLLIATFYEGLYALDTETGEVRHDILAGEANSVIKQASILCMQNLPDDRIAFGTYSNGVFVIDKDGNIINHINEDPGLQDKSVYDMYINPEAGRSSPLWLALGSGISKIEINSPLMLFEPESGIVGPIFDVLRFKNDLYVATGKGLLIQKFNKNNNSVFKELGRLKNTSCWSLCKFVMPDSKREVLLVGTMEGIYEIDEQTIIKKIDIDIKLPPGSSNIFAFFLTPSKRNENWIYLGDSEGLKVLGYMNGKWKLLYNINAIKSEARMIVEDKAGDVWLGTSLSGIFRIKNIESKPEIKNYTAKDGLPDVTDANPVLSGDSIFIGTRKGLYKLNETTGRFETSNHFGNSFTNGTKGIYEVVGQDAYSSWVSCISNQNNFQRNWIEKIVRMENGSIHSDLIPLKRLPNKWTDIVYPDLDSVAWIGMSDNLFCYNLSNANSFANEYNAEIRNINIKNLAFGDDSALFRGTFYSVLDSNRYKILQNQLPDLKSIIPYNYNNISFTFASSCFVEEKSVRYSYLIKGLRDAWSDWSSESKATFTNLSEGNYEFMVKAKNIYDVESNVVSYKFKILPPWYRTIWAYLAYLIFLGLIIWTFFVQIGNRRLERQVKLRTTEVLKQKEEIERKNKDIMSSIQYAYRIQTALLPPGDYLDQIFPERFILYLPRDIVSGDFYWLTKQGQKIITVTADCTGHGVPGAMMSMLGITLLNEIISKNENLKAHEILNSLRSTIIQSFRQTGKIGETQDGMDMALYILDLEAMTLEFAGANQSLNLVHNGQMQVIKGDNMPIGISGFLDRSFISHSLSLQKGDMIYTFSDGYHDQFGGPKQKRMLVYNLRKLLVEIHGKNLSDQKEILQNHYLSWKGDGFQVDDITIIGIRV